MHIAYSWTIHLQLHAKSNNQKIRHEMLFVKPERAQLNKARD